MTGALFLGLLFNSAFHYIISLFCKKNYLKTFQSSLLFAVGWLLLVTILLCIPGSKLPKINWNDKIWLDKWAHFFLFLTLVFLWCRVYTNKIPPGKVKRIYLAIVIISMIYGIGTEIVQHYFIPFRYFDYRDIIADSLGAMAGYFFAGNRFLKNRLEK